MTQPASGKKYPEMVAVDCEMVRALLLGHFMNNLK